MKFTSPASRLGLTALIFATSLSAVLISCSTGQSSEAQDTTAAYAAEDMPFDTLLSFVNWTELGMHATPSEKGKYITTVYLGEHVTLTGDTATELVKGKKVLYRKATLGDGKEGWLRDEFLAVDAVPGVVVGPVSLYQRPEETTLTDKGFTVLDFVAVKPSKGDWIEVIGKPAGGTWFQKGYLHVSDVTLWKLDVDLAVLYRRAMETKDETAQQNLMSHIRQTTRFEISQFFPVIFPEFAAENEDAGEYGDAYDEGDGGDGDYDGSDQEDYGAVAEHQMYNFSNSDFREFENAGATSVSDRDGYEGAALSFDGNAFIYKTLDDGTAASYCFWIKPTKTDGDEIALSMGNACTSGYQITLDDDKKGGKRIDVLLGGVTTLLTKSETSIPVNQWSHVCLLRDGNDFRLYVNGEQTSSGTSGYNPSNNVLTIGGTWACNPTKQKGTFTGLIDDLFVANYIISDDMIEGVKRGDYK